MKFSEYLRLNEGNYGHEFGEEAEKHEAANEANREHAAAKRDESTMAPKKPHLQVGANSQAVADRTMSPELRLLVMQKILSRSQMVRLC